MAWTITTTEPAKKQFTKLHKDAAARCFHFLKYDLALRASPTTIGTALVGRPKRWRYRVGDFRIICDINYKTKVILVMSVGHRKDAYR